MTKPDDTTKPPEPAKSDAPVLKMARFPGGVQLSGMDVVHKVTPGEHGRQVAVQGGSVFVLDRGGVMVELPRALCVLTYEVPAGMSIGDAVAKITKGGR